MSERAILLWRRGVRRPSGANMLAITELARAIPGGVEALCQADAGALAICVRDGDTGSDEGE